MMEASLDLKRTILLMTGLSLVLLVPLGVIVFVFQALHSDPSGADPTVVFTDAPAPERRDSGARASEWIEPPAAPLEGVPLAAVGRVLDASLEPVADGEVRLGDERVALGADGSFEFPPAVRGGHLPLEVYTRGGLRIASFPGTVTGVALDEERDALIPRVPERLRWTLTLLDSASVSGARGRDLSLGVEKVLVEEWGNGARLRVQGWTNLPDGAGVECHVTFDGHRVIGSRGAATVAEGKWSATLFAPDSHHLYSGPYEVFASFNPLLDFTRLGEWKLQYPEVAWDQVGEIQGTAVAFVGDPLDALQEDLAVERYYKDLLPLARTAYLGLKSRVREIERLGRGWDPAFIAAHRKAHDAWFQEAYVDADGMLAEAAWRRFLDDEWRPRTAAWLEAHDARHGEKYVSAHSRMKSVLESLLTLSRAYSTFVVYARFQLPRHPNDFFVDEREAQDIGLLESIIDHQLGELRRFAGLVSGAR